jgi:hypothetical protein
MTRYHNINGEHVAFSDAEEAERNAEEKAWADKKTDREMEILRTKRNQLLAETDWWAMPDSPEMTDSQTKYRQDLRDVTKQDDLTNINWPTKPE